ncbi:hypothetical protein FRC14_007771 [Serendipita sp. 396]|nr:hypothetical protein FRC14_007771 [Serendipita sp. 396]KAG8776791.1 hypothetical protein FRC15_011750 [Serendipita sp. 397]KAG8798597.1 hypothetical protein FRC16_006946 [Serendipita sp. 398]KAG8818132.1 hypothetical protein FRC19_010857 [Serendipita sp. 401]KAG8864392.1 hypothetical protein FRC20_010262 [Serendipita sp. 405]KAG9052056.1 hypothetical protein FS842_010576 [Serendipita sp. 407]
MASSNTTNTTTTASAGGGRLQLPGHRRGRSHSTTTAIQHRPALATTPSSIANITNRSSQQTSLIPGAGAATTTSTSTSTGNTSTTTMPNANTNMTMTVSTGTSTSTSNRRMIMDSQSTLPPYTPTTPNWTKERTFLSSGAIRFGNGQTSSFFGGDVENNNNNGGSLINKARNIIYSTADSTFNLFKRVPQRSWLLARYSRSSNQKGQHGYGAGNREYRRSTSDSSSSRSSASSGNSTDDLPSTSTSTSTSASAFASSSPVAVAVTALDTTTPTPTSAGNHAYSPLLFVILLFPLSTALVIGSLWTLPVLLPTREDDDNQQHTVFPRTIAEVRAIAWALKGYSETGPWELIHVLAVLAVTALWKHAWSIPGSALLNILTGTLLPPVLATLIQTSLTTLGSLLSTILATPLSPLILRFFPSAVALTRSALEGPTATSSSSSSASIPLSNLVNSDANASTLSVEKKYRKTLKRKRATTGGGNGSTWARLSVLRLIGIVPWSGINIACGVCNVSLVQCAIGAFIGTLPWTAVTCQIGDLLQSIVAQPLSPNVSGGGAGGGGGLMGGGGVGGGVGETTVSGVLTSPSTIFKLVFLSLVSLAPVLAKDWMSKWLNGGGGGEGGDNVDGNDGEEMGGEENGEMEDMEVVGVAGGKRGRRHTKRFSIDWWRRSLSLSSAKGKERERERERERREEEGRASEEERIELVHHHHHQHHHSRA